MFNAPSFEAAMQTLSRSSANGILHVTGEVSTLALVVVNGQIVHVEDAAVPQHLAICMMLQQAGCLADTVVELLGKSEISLEQLRQVLVSKNYLSEWEFDQAKRAYELNLLYGLREFEGLDLEFSEANVSPGPADVLSVQPTQILLDLVELDLDEEEFTKVYGSKNSLEQFLVLNEVDEQVLSSDERIVCGIISDGCTTADVFELSLLSEQAVVGSLMSLHSKGFVTVSGDAPLDIDSNQHESEFSSLEEDAPLFEGLFDDELEAEASGDVSAGDGVFDGQGVWGAFDGVDSVDGEIDPGQPVDFESDEDEDEFEDDDMAFPAELEAESNRWAEKENDESNFSGPVALLRSINYRLTEPAVIQNIVIVATSIYLLVFALIVPDQVETWFHALADFTNIPR